MLGGYAIAFHGHPRYTKDLDVRMEMSEENAEVIIKQWIETAKDLGRQIPEPKGRLVIA